MSYCNDCKHRHVCKYKEAADKFQDKVNELLKDESNDPDDLFNVEIKCKNHSWDYPKEWDQPGVKGIKLPTTITTDGTSSNPCDGCPNRIVPDGYVGDWPCQWCDKYPWKITWGSK